MRSLPLRPADAGRGPVPLARFPALIAARGSTMATTDKPKPAEDIPPDLMPLIQASGLLSERQFRDLKARVLDGAYPLESRALAQRLVRDKLLTEYQARRLLSNKPNGLVVGRYIIMDRIGSGSMGRVYKAHHQLMDRVVALKIIAPEIVSNTRVVARFQREMRLVGRLDHPNVVRAFDADQLGDILYIVMEFVAGRSLGMIFRNQGPIDPMAVVGYAAQAATGLAHAHEQGIVHRDVKPSNLLLSETGQLKVLDLGLGVLMEADEETNFATADGIAVGTIDYMSPEQACGKEVDGRSDIFSLGCTMYHLISGRLPYPGETPVDRLGRRLSGSFVPIVDVKPDTPAPIVKVLERMMASRPSERFQTAAELAKVLEGLGRPRPAASSASAPRKPAARPASAASMPAAQGAAAPVATATAAPPVAPLLKAAPATRYPEWFRPLAHLAERSPAGALVALTGALLGAFAAGFAVALALG